MPNQAESVASSIANWNLSDVGDDPDYVGHFDLDLPQNRVDWLKLLQLKDSSIPPVALIELVTRPHIDARQLPLNYDAIIGRLTRLTKTLHGQRQSGPDGDIYRRQVEASQADMRQLSMDFERAVEAALHDRAATGE